MKNKKNQDFQKNPLTHTSNGRNYLRESKNNREVTDKNKKIRIKSLSDRLEKVENFLKKFGVVISNEDNNEFSSLLFYNRIFQKNHKNDINNSCKNVSNTQSFLHFLKLLNDKNFILIALVLILQRACIDLKFFEDIIFGKTWEYKILQVLLTYGPMNKSQLCSKLFPTLIDSHYKLSRSTPVRKAFNYLLTNKIIIVTNKAVTKKIYDISPQHYGITSLLVIQKDNFNTKKYL